MRSKLAVAALCTMPFIFTTACSKAKSVEANVQPDAPVVAVAKARPQDMSKSVVLTAEFKPFQEVDVMAKVAGYVKQIDVDIGDRVRQGQLLATLEIPEMHDDLARSKANLQRSQADVTRSKDELQRAQSQHDVVHVNYERLAGVMKAQPGLVAQQEVDDAHGRDLVAESQVSAARSALAAAEQAVGVAQAEQAKIQTLLNYANVTAPFTGVVTKRFADTGSMIQAGTSSQTQAMPVVRLSQNNLLRLILPVPESVVPTIHLGQSVEVKVPSLHRNFPGKVARFADRVNLDTRTMETEVDVPNPQLVLVPGMYAEVDLTLEHRANALAIPISAIAGTQDNPQIYVVTPQNKIEVRRITLGLETANRAEVRSGLQDGEMVVIGNRSQLTHGQQVVPKPTELAALESERP
jgi:RND family efflux transporter MFP subunit